MSQLRPYQAEVVERFHRTVEAGCRRPLIVARTGAVDLLSQATGFLRPRLDRSKPISERLKTFWAGYVAARDLGSVDVIEREFLALAQETGIACDLGRHSEEDLQHVIRMAMLRQNPFQ